VRYNPEDDKGGAGEGGKFPFKVDEAEEKKFGSGNEGLKVKLLVNNGKRDVPSYENFIYRDDLLWRVRKFMASLGLDFDDKSIQPADFVGRTGRAEFVVDKEGYLKGKKWIPADGFKGKSGDGPAADAPIEDVPF
jgi:hypothetical protein